MRARRLVFDARAWADYLYWQAKDSRALERINRLILECQRDPFRGVGKPEPLKGQLTGCWSRRIDDTHRLVYRVNEGSLEIVACRFHYSR
jgi:toxin YoeB